MTAPDLASLLAESGRIFRADSRERAVLMRTRLAFPLLAILLAGCGTPEYDPGSPPDVKTILTPQLDSMFPGSAVFQGTMQIPAVPMKPGMVEIAPVRAAQALAPAPWIACLRIDDKGRRRQFAMFFNEKLLVLYREALPPDRCDGEAYTVLRRKAPGT